MTIGGPFDCYPPSGLPISDSRKTIGDVEAEIIPFPMPQPPERVGDGWVLMPERLTYGMILAAGEAVEDFHSDGSRGFVGMITAVYEAMKAAAPKGKPAA